MSEWEKNGKRSEVFRHGIMIVGCIGSNLRHHNFESPSEVYFYAFVHFTIVSVLSLQVLMLLEKLSLRI